MPDETLILFPGTEEAEAPPAPEDALPDQPAKALAAFSYSV